MADGVNGVSKARGLGMQCPFSKCMPQLYTSQLYKASKKPCVNTPFAEFREVLDHIWKYHSYLLCCESCDHRFSGANRGENEVARSQLRELKALHAKDHRAGSSKKLENLKDPRETMTAAQDELLKTFTAPNGKSVETMISNYEKLCRLLFGEEVEVPEPSYNYFVLEHTINPSSRDRGERNLDYVARKREQEIVCANPSVSDATTSGATAISIHDTSSMQWMSSPNGLSTARMQTTMNFFASPNALGTHLEFLRNCWVGPNRLSLDDPEPDVRDEPVMSMLQPQTLTSEADSAYYTASDGVARKTNANMNGNPERGGGYLYWTPLSAPQQPNSAAHMGDPLSCVGSHWNDMADMNMDMENLPPEAVD